MTGSLTKISGTTSGDIAASIRNLISSGTLTPGDSLPAIRALADHLGVNRNTVASAYTQLANGALVEARRRGGTRVLGAPAIGGEGRSAPRSTINLASGNPSAEFLPILTPELLTGYRARLYGDPPVLAELHDWAVQHMAADLETPGDLVITHGAVDAVWRILTTNLARGDTVALENPGFMTQVGLLKVTGHKPAPVSVDDHGMLPRSLKRALMAGARAVIVTPRAQNPTGAYLSLQRAQDLRAVLDEHPNVLVIEDDHFSETSSEPYYRVTPPSTLNWALVRTVTKFLGPDLRLALVMANTGTARGLSAMVSSPANWVSHLLQNAVSNLLRSEETTKLLDSARDSYRARSQHLIEELNMAGLSVSTRCDGLNVWVPVSRSPVLVTRQLEKLGWAVMPSQSFSVTEHATWGVRVTTASLDATQAEGFARDLQTVVLP